MNAEIRETTGKGAAHKLRATGKIPAVVYGKEINPVTVTLDARELSELLITGKALRSLVSLKIEGRSDIGKKVLMFKEIQRHHIKRTPMAADLFVVDPTKEIEIPVPVMLVGHPKGVALGGVLQHLCRYFLIRANVKDLPEFVELDVTEILPGDTKYVEDFDLPEGVSVNLKGKTPVCTMTIPRELDLGEEEEEEEEEGEEGVEGEEGAEGKEGEEGAKEEKPSKVEKKY